jgi:hypothetical protein
MFFEKGINYPKKIPIKKINLITVQNTHYKKIEIKG